MDLAATCATHVASKGVVRAGAIAAALLPQSTRGFLEGGSATHRTLMQNGSAKNFIFDLGCIIQHLSNIMTLWPGDLISTGPPAGVGFSRKPPVTLQPGNVCKLEITGLGTLENPVKDT